MRRIVAVVFVGVGLMLVGIALGLVYLDLRAAAARANRIQTAMQMTTPYGESPRDESRIWAALVSGSVGAGLFGSGCLLALLQLSACRSGPERVPPPGR